MSPLVAALPAAPAFLGQLPSADAWLANTTEFAEKVLATRKAYSAQLVAALPKL